MHHFHIAYFLITTDSYRLKKDRERQEQLARERLEARRNARKKKGKIEEEPEPEKGIHSCFVVFCFLFLLQLRN